MGSGGTRSDVLGGMKSSKRLSCRVLAVCACLLGGLLIIALNFVQTPINRPRGRSRRELAIEDDTAFAAVPSKNDEAVDHASPSTVPITLSVPHNYSRDSWRSSAHTCFSRDHGPEAARHAACMFQMLCVVSTENNEKGEWLYLADQHEKGAILDFSVGIGPHHVDDRVFFPVKTTTLDHFRKLYPEARIESQPHFLFSEYNAENYGHFLTDLLVPIYTVLDGFDAVDTDIQLLHFRPKDPIGWSCDFQATTGMRAKEKCDRFYNSLTPMISRHKIKDLPEVMGPPGNAICFNKLYVGASRFSAFCFDGADSRGMKEGDHNYPNMPCYNGRQKQLWDFRAYSKANLGVPEIPPRKHQVLIWDRPDKRKFHGLDKLARRIEQQLNVSVIVVTDWSQIPIEKQLQMIGETTVHVTSVGGGSFIALHLPRGATTIRLSRSQDSFMEAWVFDFLGYVHPIYYTSNDNPLDIDVMMDFVITGLKRYEAFGLPFD